MAYDEMAGLQQLSRMDTRGAPSPAPGGPTPGGPTPPELAPGNVVGGAPTQGMGGPGIDTPQEQRAMEMLTQGAQILREAANTDPSIRYIIDKILMDGFTQVMKHYGLEEQGKVALQQAQLQKRDQDTLRRAPTGPPQGGPPVGGPPVA